MACKLRKKIAVKGDPKRWIEHHFDFDGAECLIWPFARCSSGYPNMKSGWPLTIMCEKVHGEKPSLQHQVAHSCGNGHLGCIHPKHIRWATVSENHEDKRRHGTLIFGDRASWRKLSTADVKNIKLRRNDRLVDLADEFGVHPETIGRIRRGLNWKHI